MNNPDFLRDSKEVKESIIEKTKKEISELDIKPILGSKGYRSAIKSAGEYNAQQVGGFFGGKGAIPEAEKLVALKRAKAKLKNLQVKET